MSVEAQLCPQGWLVLPPSATRLIISPRSRWRLQLHHWDGKPAQQHQAELVEWRKLQMGSSALANTPAKFYPFDRLVLNTGGEGEPASLHTRAAACGHRGAPLDKSSLVRVPSPDGQWQGLALRCLTCQRRPNLLDGASAATVCDDGSIRLRFTNNPQHRFQDHGPATVVHSDSI